MAKNITYSILACFIFIINSITSVQIVEKRELECALSENVRENIANYAQVTNDIIDYFVKGPLKGKTWNSLSEFVDTFGNRLSGTKNLENSIDYMIEKTRENNIKNVYTEEVEVPYWLRGEEYALLMKPRVKNLPMLGLGYSVATPPDGIIANAIVVKSFDELKSLPDAEVANKIVVYDEAYVNYGVTVKYRSKGASEAAKKGAVGALIRSVTPFSMNTPHTGMQSYDANVTKIPVAAITHEDADLLWRLQERGKEIVIKMKMSATLSTKTSRNTIIDTEGTTKKDKVVIVSGHIDSWDVGDGSMDDGGGAFISWMAQIALNQMNLRPKRTLRTILWTAEELGLVGSREYGKRHRNETENLNFVMESDGGVFQPLGLIYSGSKTGECMIKEILKLFSSINATQIQTQGEPGPDIGMWTRDGIPGGGLLNEASKYFWYHHSEGDRLNVMDSDVLDLAAAFWTAFSYIVADIDSDIPRSP
ncbi:carboxypeptidase Q-like [Arctopsyche grandis]|uniref:carboxypeptidase Q-like n=1 Tax=Arctopsyche grandis TaxID=121162 RepID=UPI00406D6500